MNSSSAEKLKHRTLARVDFTLRRRRSDRFRVFCLGGLVIVLLAIFVVCAKVVADGIVAFSGNSLALNVALLNSLVLVATALLVLVPMIFLAVVYLEEPNASVVFRRLVSFSVNYLAAVPPVVFGVFALGLHLYWAASISVSVVAACALLAMILPELFISVQTAVRSVSASTLMAAHALGASRWQIVTGHILPATALRIVAGVVSAAASAVASAAVLLLLALIAASMTPLSSQIFLWLSAASVVPQSGDTASMAASGSLILLLLVLSLKLIASLINQLAMNPAEGDQSL